MDTSKHDAFFEQLIQMYTAAELPFVVTDCDFKTVHCSAQARLQHPCLALPDGMRVVLRNYDLAMIRRTITEQGSFHCEHAGFMMQDFGIMIFSVSDASEELYLVQFPPQSSQGTGLHPEGISRTLSSFSNQFRSPVTSIFSSLSLIAQAVDTNEEDETRRKLLTYTETINQNTYQLLRNYENISEFTRLSNGLSSLRLNYVDIYDYLRRFCAAAAEVTAQLDIPVNADIPGDCLPIACDTVKISTVLLHLLSNACRFSRPNNRIDFKVRQYGENISVTIADQGLGIPSSVLPRVYEPYFSYDHLGAPFAGSGLGLAISTLAVTQMGGALTLVSVEGEGTTAAFTIPIRTGSPELPATNCDPADYLSDRFSPLWVAMCDSVKCPLTLR